MVEQETQDVACTSAGMFSSLLFDSLSSRSRQAIPRQLTEDGDRRLVRQFIQSNKKSLCKKWTCTEPLYSLHTRSKSSGSKCLSDLLRQDLLPYTSMAPQLIAIATAAPTASTSSIYSELKILQLELKQLFPRFSQDALFENLQSFDVLQENVQSLRQGFQRLAQWSHSECLKFISQNKEQIFLKQLSKDINNYLQRLALLETKLQSQRKRISYQKRALKNLEQALKLQNSLVQDVREIYSYAYILIDLLILAVLVLCMASIIK